MRTVPGAETPENTGSDRNDASRPAAEGLSRRRMLGAAAMAGVGAVCMIATRAEAAKMKPTMAKYQTEPKGEAKCEGCTHFQAPNACQIVDGEISPNGWCQLYAKKG